jgi:hypothetical protein
MDALKGNRWIAAGATAALLGLAAWHLAADRAPKPVQQITDDQTAALTAYAKERCEELRRAGRRSAPCD